MIHIDESRCKRDGICAAECPTAIIRLTDGPPEMVPGGEGACLACGHCVAVCPHGALSHDWIPLEACPPMEEALAVTEAQAVQFLRSRRSVRIFLDRPVEREKVQRLMEIARYAPTGGNSQQVHWTVFTDKARIDEMARLSVEWLRTSMAAAPPGALPPYIPRVVSAWDAGFDAVLRGAPVLIVASAPATAPNGLVDLTLALSYLDLAAPTLGLGTCWAGILRGALHASAPLKAMVGLPEGHTHQYPMMLGYPKFKYHRLPERRPPAVTWK